MKHLIQILVSGVTLGSIFALMSMGLSVIWGGLRVLNLCQGALFMLGAYSSVVVSNTLHFGPGLGLLAAFLFTGMLGIILYVGPIRLLMFRDDRDNSILLATAALGIVFENAALFTFGPRNQAVPDLLSGRFHLYGVVVTWNALLMTVTAIALLAALGAALKWTRLGLAVRALAQNSGGAQLSGINVDRVFALVMFVSSGLAGIGGVLLSSYYFVNPYVGENYLLTALIVTILGGLGSLSGTLYASYLVGMIQSAISFYFGVRWSLPVLFALIILTLVVRPGGLAGRALSNRL